MKKIPVWPTLATVSNLLCGFSAVAYAFGGNFRYAAWLILAAMLFDAADGRLARLTRTSTEFGGQLDSLADLVSFGVAPAFLMHNFVHAGLPEYSQKFGWAVAGLYVVCAALRLARFNVENTTHHSSHKSFKGLPSPAAAGLVATSVILMGDAASAVPVAFIAFIPLMTLAVAVLMVTKIRYPHVVSQLDIGGRPFSFVVLMVFVGMLVALAPEVGFFILFALYAASGPVGLTLDQILERFAASNNDDGLF